MMARLILEWHQNALSDPSVYRLGLMALACISHKVEVV